MHSSYTYIGVQCGILMHVYMHTDQIRVTKTSLLSFFMAKSFQSSMQYYATTYCFYAAAESKNGCCPRGRDENGGYQRLRGQEALRAVGEGYILIPARGSSGSFLKLYWLPDWPFCCLIVFDTGAYLQSIPMATTVGF